MTTPDPRPLSAEALTQVRAMLGDSYDASLVGLSQPTANTIRLLLGTSRKLLATLDAERALHAAGVKAHDAELRAAFLRGEEFCRASHAMVRYAERARHAALVEAAQAAVLVGDGLRGWWRDGEDVATVPLVSLGAVQAAIARLRAALLDGWQERGNPGDEG